MGMRKATIEDVRDALAKISVGKSEASTRQYVLRVKSLLGYAQRSGYTLFNAGATIKVRSDAANRGANLAKRIIPEVDVKLLLRAAPSWRDCILLEVTYAGGLRVSEVVALAWADVLARDERVQLSITGKGGKVCQVLLPEVVSRSLLNEAVIAALAAPCARLPCHRPRRHAAGGASHPAPWQRVDHEWLSARAA
jgi:integrase/recombinase XerD